MISGVRAVALPPDFVLDCGVSPGWGCCCACASGSARLTANNVAAACLAAHQKLTGCSMFRIFIGPPWTGPGTFLICLACDRPISQRAKQSFFGGYNAARRDIERRPVIDDVIVCRVHGKQLRRLLLGVARYP